MLRKLGLKIGIVVGMFLAFTAIYKVLQKKNIYDATLGKVTLNYTRVDTNNTSVIKEKNVPFTPFIEEKSYHWDAAYYKSIRDSMYAGAEATVVYRYAFYPLFPVVWKLSHANVHGIVLLNYFFFGTAIILLSLLFLKDSKSELFYFILALILPGAAVYYLPYAESLFLLTFSLALFGLFKKKYWLFFIAMICFSMTRPSALLLCVVFTITNTMAFVSHKQFLRFVKECFFTVSPILIGWGLVILLQYHYSASWLTYIEACSLWPKEPDLWQKVGDWSTEGFGMTTFAVFAVAIPACIYVIVWGNATLFGKTREDTTYLFGGDEEYLKKYLFKASMLFIMGFTLFNLLSSGYQLNGFFRYTMATPFFYILLFQLPEKLKSIPFHYKLSGFVIIFVSMFLFLLSAEYAGGLYRFKYFGLLLFLFLLFAVISESHLSNKIKLFLIAIFILPCLVWHAYLLNMYLGDAWVFT